MAKSSEVRILGMTLGEFTRIYLSSTLGKVSLALFMFLIGVTIYAVIVIPHNFGTLWNTSTYWQIYPKDAPPSWVNLFTGNEYSPEVVSSNIVKSSSSSLTISFTVNNEYKSPWSDLFIVLNPPLSGISMLAYITINRPDGSTISIGPIQLGATVTEVGTLYQVEGQVVQFYATKYGYALNIPTASSAFPFIFMHVNKGTVEPLYGRYEITVTLMPITGSLPSLGDSKPVEVVLEGSAYGLMGTDTVGHDLWLGLLAGFPVSLEIGVVYALLVTVIAVGIGLTAGFIGGIVDEILTRVTDLVILLPSFVILVVLSILLHLNIWDAMLYLAVLAWGGSARIIRAISMQIKTASYIDLAKASGAGNLWILRNHVLPQITPYMLYLLVVNVPGAILTLSSLNFLNLAGVNYPTWGTILYYAEEYGALETGMWWWVIPPGLLITLVAVTFIVTALAIEPIANPRLRR
ncbi:ABC transporter permease [Caldivirga maquilingensis]|uniref:Binding-protein-dependent transport systems inner membrane component n=1 Tax=Caldivirga maquilingensis (strain ATCC 700844 / DSM 13496 / JCM 10307 / IC-167) TaxID=397948 RepID=A8MCY1_CALMQ|nr:ABC transporter permease [Caldivirga maquilingensis]ABW01637.1 binding-protein-dependent transport systems inner membrane component [Caldivirga maquilingensis IC-167]